MKTLHDGPLSDVALDEDGRVVESPPNKTVAAHEISIAVDKLMRVTNFLEDLLHELGIDDSEEEYMT